jgi:hypothetical protein
MELIRDVADWIATGWGDRLAILFPLAIFGLLGLFTLWLIIGYLRVSQVGINEARAHETVAALPAGTDTPDHPRGVPYCTYDGLQYPIGARYCAACERDLVIECTNCGATLSATDTSCYRCGTKTGVPERLLA